MAAGAFTIFSANVPAINIDDLLTATVKFALVSSAYTPSAGEAGHTVWANVSANEIANGNGYTTGGVTLGSKLATDITLGSKFSSANAQWTASGGSIPAWRYAVMYASGALWGVTDPLIGYFVGDSTPADIPSTPNGAPIVLVCPSGGWFDIVRA